MDKSTGYESAPPAYSDVMSNTNVMPTVHTSARKSTNIIQLSHHISLIAFGIRTNRNDKSIRIAISSWNGRWRND